MWRERQAGRGFFLYGHFNEYKINYNKFSGMRVIIGDGVAAYIPLYETFLIHETLTLIVVHFFII